MADEKEAGGGAEAESAEVVSAPKARSGLLPIIVIGVLLIVVSAGVTFVVIKMTVPAASTSGEEVVSVARKEGGGKETENLTVPVKEIFVNIKGTKGTRILKIVPTLIVSEKALVTEMTKSEALVRDRISMVAGEMTMDDLEADNGRDNLKKEIRARLNIAFQNQMAGVVTDIYFSDYLIQ